MGTPIGSGSCSRHASFRERAVRTALDRGKPVMDSAPIVVPWYAERAGRSPCDEVGSPIARKVRAGELPATRPLPTAAREKTRLRSPGRERGEASRELDRGRVPRGPDSGSTRVLRLAGARRRDLRSAVPDCTVNKRYSRRMRLPLSVEQVHSPSRRTRSARRPVHVVTPPSGEVQPQVLSCLGLEVGQRGHPCREP